MIEFQQLSKKCGERNLVYVPSQSPKSSELENRKAGDCQLIERFSELEKEMGSLNGRLATAEEMVAAKETNNIELKNEIYRLEKLVETIPILQAQV